MPANPTSGRRVVNTPRQRSQRVLSLSGALLCSHAAAASTSVLDQFRPRARARVTARALASPVAFCAGLAVVCAMKVADLRAEGARPRHGSDEVDPSPGGCEMPPTCGGVVWTHIPSKWLTS